MLVEGGGEEDGRNAGPGEGILVRSLFHHLVEGPAAIESQVQVEFVERAGADVAQVALIGGRQRVLSDGEKVLPVAAGRYQVGAQHVEVDHGRDPAVGDGQVLHEMAAPGHVELFAVEGHEKQVFPRAFPVGLHRREHPGQREEGGHAGSVVVGARIDGVAEPAEVVVVCPDDDVFIGLDGSRQQADDIAQNE